MSWIDALFLALVVGSVGCAVDGKWQFAVLFCLWAIIAGLVIAALGTQEKIERLSGRVDGKLDELLEKVDEVREEVREQRSAGGGPDEILAAVRDAPQRGRESRSKSAET